MNLVDRETSPLGVALVNPNKSGKRGAYDLVELAAGIENADQFTKANAGSKLTVIAEQARTFTIRTHWQGVKDLDQSPRFSDLA